MTEIERARLIRRSAEYIAKGKETGNIENSMTQDLNAELSEMGEIGDFELYPEAKSMNMGALLIAVEDDGKIRVRYQINDSYRNNMKNVQGGVMAALIDNALGIAVVPTFGPFLTINLDVNYLAPVSEEFEYIEIRAGIIKSGKSTKYLQAEVFRSDGKMAALAGSNIMMVRK